MGSTKVPQRDADTSGGSADPSRARAERSSGWMMLAMIAWSAVIPLGLLIAALTGSIALSSVSSWSWALLAAAVVAAGIMILRVARPR
jgi:hypothetical protein